MAYDYTAYLDASGTHSSSPVAGFSGVISTARAWMRFSKRWARVLDGPPRLESLHMATFLRHGQRAAATDLPPDVKDSYGWSKNDRQRVAQGFADSLLGVAPLFVFGCVVSIADYLDIVPPQCQAEIGSPEMMCLPWCFREILRRGIPASLDAAEQVAFVFDQDNPDRMSYALREFQRFKSIHDSADRMGTLQFANHRKMLPLQAADMIAHSERYVVQTGGMVSGLAQYVFHRIPEQHMSFFYLGRKELEEIKASQEGRTSWGLVIPEKRPA